jgi:GT2 family glycosyltransferase
MLTLPRANLVVSFILSTYNRRAEVLNTLDHISRCGLDPDSYEVFVVDNDSSDDTVDAIGEQFPHVHLLPQEKNRGSCAKNLALPLSVGRFVVFLDDDSYPRPGAIARMIRHFEEDPDLGAAVFDIELLDGSRECSAYPDVFIGCGTGFRRQALTQVGGLPKDFFMQAEEYDLSLRLIDAGWKVRRFDDMQVVHLKSPTARRSNRTTRLDVRNNLMLATRYFPRGWVRPFAVDWMKRYYKIASTKRHRGAFIAGALQGLAMSARPRHRRPISEQAFETFAKLGEIESRLRAAQQAFDLRTVLFIDLGKNVLPFYLAARNLGIQVIAIADPNLAGGRYRKIPIIDDDEARSLTFDAAVISNLSPVHAQQRRQQWRLLEHFRPVIDLFEENTQRALADVRRARAA